MLRCRKKNPPHIPNTVIKLERSLTSKNLSLSPFLGGEGEGEGEGKGKGKGKGKGLQ